MIVARERILLRTSTILHHCLELTVLVPELLDLLHYRVEIRILGSTRRVIDSNTCWVHVGGEASGEVAVEGSWWTSSG